MASHIHYTAKHGDHYAFCQICQRRLFGSELMMNYDGRKVCPECKDVKNPILDPMPDLGPDPELLPESVVSPNPNKQQFYDILESQTITDYGQDYPNNLFS